MVLLESDELPGDEGANSGESAKARLSASMAARLKLRTDVTQTTVPAMQSVSERRRGATDASLVSSLARETATVAVKSAWSKLSTLPYEMNRQI